MQNSCTAPELAVRSAAFSLGIRFRYNVHTLPGRPDLASRKLRLVIFVHGCFWHGHHGCEGARTPLSKKDAWFARVAETQRRDRLSAMKLRELGFRVVTIWDCQTKDQVVLKSLLEGYLTAYQVEVVQSNAPEQPSTVVCEPRHQPSRSLSRPAQIPRRRT